MVIVVCSCCYNPEVLPSEKYAKESLSIKFVSRFREDEDKSYFLVEVGESPPIFTNLHGIQKLRHDFLLAMGYIWEESKPGYTILDPKEEVDPTGWWYEPAHRKARLKIV